MKIQAAILDWAGTVVDHGSRAPMGAFVRAFAQFGVAITIANARGPMGMAKWDHIRAVGQIPSVAVAWRARHGRNFSEGDVDAIFQVFEPMNIAAVRDHADIIPGTIATIDAELTVCAGDLPAGRPTPLMMWYAMAKLGVWPAASVVKVDDTAPGIGEGKAAGAWTVGIALTGNATGLSAEELAALSQSDRTRLRDEAAAELRNADMVIDSIADLPGAVAAIDARLAARQRPTATSPD
jgi:phosphonoacetaldehyde hydrolase